MYIVNKIHYFNIITTKNSKKITQMMIFINKIKINVKYLLINKFTYK